MEGGGQIRDVPCDGFREDRLGGPKAKSDSDAHVRPLVAAGKNRPWAVPGNPGGGDCTGEGRIVGIVEWALL